MKTIPGSEHVDQAIKTVERRVGNALVRTNRAAAKLLAQGDYAGSQSLVEIAQTIMGFQSDLAVLQNKWRSLTRTVKSKNEAKEEITLLWEYYRPILATLEELGGTASRGEIEEGFDKSHADFLKDGDRTIMKGGLPRWRIMIHRARKPMIKEGFLDGAAKGQWRITALGRQTAQGKNPRDAK